MVNSRVEFVCSLHKIGSEVCWLLSFRTRRGTKNICKSRFCDLAYTYVRVIFFCYFELIKPTSSSEKWSRRKARAKISIEKSLTSLFCSRPQSRKPMIADLLIGWQSYSSSYSTVIEYMNRGKPATVCVAWKHSVFACFVRWKRANTSIFPIACKKWWNFSFPNRKNVNEKCIWIRESVGFFILGVIVRCYSNSGINKKVFTVIMNGFFACCFRFNFVYMFILWANCRSLDISFNFHYHFAYFSLVVYVIRVHFYEDIISLPFFSVCVAKQSATFEWRANTNIDTSELDCIIFINCV